MKKVIILSAICLASGFSPRALADIIHVPGDHPTIQEGIDAACEGDTVLVKPGEYVENVDFIGKNIVVASLFLTSANPEFISTTIIDGDSTGSVVTFENGEDSTAVICGFTLKNGYNFEGGGILSKDSGPVISYNIIKNNSAVYSRDGGGIHCSYSNARIRGNKIMENYGCHGGGINGEYSNLVIEDNLIIDNEANP